MCEALAAIRRAAPDPISEPTGFTSLVAGQRYRTEYGRGGFRIDLDRRAPADQPPMPDPRLALPSPGRPAAPPAFLDYRLARVESGNLVHYDRMTGANERPHRGARGDVLYRRTPDLWEVYEERPSGVEQSFLLLARPALDGDLVICGDVRTDLVPAAVSAADGGVDFLDPMGGAPVLHYGAATALDSAGRRAECPVSCRAGRLSIRVPAAWLAAGTFPVLVDPLIGPNFQVTSDPGSEKRPDIAHDANHDRYLVVFEQAVPHAGREVHGRLLNADGTPAGDAVTISGLPRDDRKPRVAFSARAGRWLVVWEHAGHDIYGRVLNADLTPVGAPFWIDRLARGASSDPAVANRTATGQFCVIWDETGAAHGGRDIVGALVDQAGSVVRGPISLRHSRGRLAHPALAYGETLDAFFIAHESGGDRIQGFSFDGGLTRQTTPVVAISAAPGEMRRPAVAWNATRNEFLVAFENEAEDEGPVESDNEDDNIVAQRIDASNGTPTGAAITVAGTAGDDQDPRVAFSTGSSSYAVVWNHQQANGHWDVLGQELAGDGTLAGPALAVSQAPDPATNEVLPAIAFGGAGSELACVWQDGRAAAGFDIWGQRISTAAAAPRLQQEPINNPIRLGGEGSVFGHSGEVIVQRSIATIPGVGPAFDFVLTYRSGNSNDSSAGFGWEHSYDQRIESTGVAGASDAIVHDGTGRADRHSWDGTKYVTPDGFYNLLAYDRVNDRFTLRDRHGLLMTYSQRAGALYRVTEIKDRNENALVLAYDPAGRLATIAETRGQVVTFSYTPEGRIDFFTDWAGRRYDFTFDANGDLVEYITPAVPDFPAGRKTVFTYLSGQAQPWLNHNLVSITDPKGQRFLVNTYDPPTDRVTDQQCGALNQVYHFQYSAGRTREINRRGFPTDHEFNAQGNCTRKTDAAGFVWQYAYNVHMEEVQEIMPRGNSTRWTYDTANADRLAQGNLLEVRRSTGGLSPEPEIVTTTAYETHFNWPKTVTDPRGFTTTSTFDYEVGGPDHGNVVRVDHPLVSLGQPAPQAIAERMTYNLRGQPTSLTNGEGNVTEYVYYAPPDPQAGFLEKVIAGSGGPNLTTRYGYDAVGNQTAITDPRGNTWTRLVDALNEVTRTIAPAPFGYSVDFRYDGNGNQVQIDAANIDETGAPYPNAVLTTIQEFDFLNNLVTESREIDASTLAVTTYERDENENVVHTTLPEGNEVHETYDARDLVTETTRGCNCGGLATETRAYDANRNLTQVVRGEGGNHKNTYAYDGFDRRTRDTDGLGNHTDVAYDPASNRTVTARVSSPGTTLTRATYSYDELGRAFQEDRLFQDSSGAPVGDGLATTKRLFDRSSREVAVTDDNNHIYTHSHDAANRSVKTVDPLGEATGNKVEYVLDPDGNQTRVTETEFNQATAAAEVIVTDYVYDQLNRVTQRTEDPGGLNLVTVMKYDSRDNQTVVTDAEGRTTRRAFDGLRRLLSTRFDEGALNIVVQEGWDRNSRLTSQTDDNGNVTRYAYTTRDLLETKTYADGATETYVYNLDDKVTQITDPNGSVITNTYDDADLLLQRDIARAPAVLGATQELYQYDGAYRRTRAENREGATPICVCESFYNTLGMVDREVHTIGTQPARTVASTFDGVGNRLTYTYPSGRALAQAFDAANHMTEIREGATALAAFQYAGAREARRTYANGMVKDATYDARRRVTRIRHATTAGLEKSRLEYAYDGVHNRKYERRVELGFDEPDTAQVYRYDGIYQVDGAKFGVPGADVAPGKSFADYATWTNKHEWTFDGVGNRKTMDRNGAVEPYDSPGGTYAPDARNRYYDVGGVTRLHDANGNVTDDGSFFAFAYDYKNELVRVTRRSDSVVVGTYSYDAEGRRVTRTASPTQVFYWCCDRIVETVDAGTGATTESHVYGKGADELLSSDLGATPQRVYFHENAVGSIVDLTDRFGEVREEYRYDDIYGHARFYNCTELLTGKRLRFETTDSFLKNRILFAAQRFNPECQLYSVQRGYLTSAVGRLVNEPYAGWKAPGCGGGCARGAAVYNPLMNPFTIMWNSPVSGFASSMGMGPAFVLRGIKHGPRPIWGVAVGASLPCLTLGPLAMIACILAILAAGALIAAGTAKVIDVVTKSKPLGPTGGDGGDPDRPPPPDPEGCCCLYEWRIVNPKPLEGVLGVMGEILKTGGEVDWVPQPCDDSSCEAEWLTTAARARATAKARRHGIFIEEFPNVVLEMNRPMMFPGMTAAACRLLEY